MPDRSHWLRIFQDESGTAAGMQKNRRIELRFIMTTPGGNDADTVAHQIDAEKAK